MELGVALQFALGLWAIISGLSLIIGQLHMIEKAEQQEWQTKLKELTNRQS